MPRLPKKLDKVKTLRPVRPNAGISATYRKRLLSLVELINVGTLSAISGVYKKDWMTGGFPAKVIHRAMQDYAAEWETKIASTAPRLAEWFAQSVKNYSDPALMAILKEGGFAVKFTVTPKIQNVLDSVISENVSLIKSIPTQHLREVEEMVMRSVQKGRDLGTLTAELQDRFGVSRRRAMLIARDQNNKATAAITRTRHMELGITQAVWKHSHAGKHPRPTHVAADGRVYQIDRGCLIPPTPGAEAEFIYPGEAINCRCCARPIMPFPQ